MKLSIARELYKLTPLAHLPRDLRSHVVVSTMEDRVSSLLWGMADAWVKKRAKKRLDETLSVYDESQIAHISPAKKALLLHLSRDPAEIEPLLQNREVLYILNIASKEVLHAIFGLHDMNVRVFLDLVSWWPFCDMLAHTKSENMRVYMRYFQITSIHHIGKVIDPSIRNLLQNGNPKNLSTLLYTWFLSEDALIDMVSRKPVWKCLMQAPGEVFAENMKYAWAWAIELFAKYPHIFLTDPTDFRQYFDELFSSGISQEENFPISTDTLTLLESVWKDVSGNCSNLEYTNAQLLFWKSDECIYITLDGMLIWHIKTVGISARTFLSYRDISDAQGNILFSRGSVYRFENIPEILGSWKNIYPMEGVRPPTFWKIRDSRFTSEEMDIWVQRMIKKYRTLLSL